MLLQGKPDEKHGQCGFSSQALQASQAPFHSGFAGIKAQSDQMDKATVMFDPTKNAEFS